MTFNELCNHVCGTLPRGWSITIDLERECGSVDLFDNDAERIEFPTNYECIADQVWDAIEHAIETEKKEWPQPQKNIRC